MATNETIGNGSTSVSDALLKTLATEKAAVLAFSTTPAEIASSTSELGPSKPNPELESATDAETTGNLEVTTTGTANTAAGANLSAETKWPGWPGDCVFRLIVPVLKVGSIIGRKGELIKKMCEETRARIRVLDGALGTSDRIVLISGKEEPEAPLSPAMDAVIRVFKRVSGLSESECENKAPEVAGIAFCSIRMLVASTQAINLIGKQGCFIKAMQESTGASVRVLSAAEAPFYDSPDERIVELQGEALKVLKALEAVVGHLRKFLVDHSVLPLFEKGNNTTASQERQPETRPDKLLLHTAPQTGIAPDYPLPTKRESLFLDRESHLGSQITSSQLSLYGQELLLTGFRSSGLGRTGAPIVTQITQTMQVPLSYAEDIIGVGGSNIAFIRQSSRAILTIQESRGLPDEITIEIKGTSTQVQKAQQLIQEVISSREEQITNTYASRFDLGLRSTYSQYGGSTYSSSSSLPSQQPYGGGGAYGGSSGSGGYSTFRL